MSLLSEARFFVKKFFKNPLLVTTISFLIYRMLNKYKKKSEKEAFALLESIKVIKEENNKIIIFDRDTKMYILTDEAGNEIWASKDLKDVEAKL